MAKLCEWRILSIDSGQFEFPAWTSFFCFQDILHSGFYDGSEKKIICPSILFSFLMIQIFIPVLHLLESVNNKTHWFWGLTSQNENTNSETAYLRICTHISKEAYVTSCLRRSLRLPGINRLVAHFASCWSSWGEKRNVSGRKRPQRGLKTPIQYVIHRHPAGEELRSERITVHCCIDFVCLSGLESLNRTALVALVWVLQRAGRSMLWVTASPLFLIPLHGWSQTLIWCRQNKEDYPPLSMNNRLFSVVCQLCSKLYSCMNTRLMCICKGFFPDPPYPPSRSGV